MSVALAMATSCSKDDDMNNVPAGSTPIGEAHGTFVVNEGAFGVGNGSVSFFDPQQGSMTNKIFLTVNNFTLGDVVQSMNKIDGLFYIVVNNSQKVEVADGSSFKSVGTVAGLGSPRYAVGAATGKIYVSDWGDNTVKVVSASTHAVTGSIATGSGPERMLVIGGRVYVANAGGFSEDSTVTVVDVSTDAVAATVPVGVNPNSLVADVNGKVWVLCAGSLGPDWTGGTADDVAGSLWRIDPSADTVEAVFAMAPADHPVKLAVNKSGTALYYLNGSSGYDGRVFRMGIGDTMPPATALVGRTFYGLGIEPDNEQVYGAYAPSFSQDGFLFRYQSNGTLIDSTAVGVAPNGFYFNY